MDDNNIDNGENHPVQESEQDDRATATELAASARLRLMSCLQEYDDYPQQTRSKTDEMTDELIILDLFTQQTLNKTDELVEELEFDDLNLTLI